jgi:hypothetical protein
MVDSLTSSLLFLASLSTFRFLQLETISSTDSIYFVNRPLSAYINRSKKTLPPEGAAITSAVSIGRGTSSLSAKSPSFAGEDEAENCAFTEAVHNRWLTGGVPCSVHEVNC